MTRGLDCESPTEIAADSARWSRLPGEVGRRVEAQRRCCHHCCIRADSAAESPRNGIEARVLWCVENVGPWHDDWYYRGGGTWCFARLEDMVRFQLVWV